MSAFALTLLGTAGNREIYSITPGNAELDSSFGTGKEPREPSELDRSRYEERKKLNLVVRNPGTTGARVTKISEQKSGSVNF